MTDERLILAIGRIERAISRLEVRDAATSSQDSDDALAAANLRIAALERQHEKLRASASEAIARIDRLLEQGAE